MAKKTARSCRQVFVWSLLALLVVPAVVRAQVAFPGASWEERTPAQVGLDAAAIDAVANQLGGDGVIVRNGYLVKKWGNFSGRGDWASAMKPVMSTLLWFAIEEGRIASVDAERLQKGIVLQRLPKDLPAHRVDRTLWAWIDLKGVPIRPARLPTQAILHGIGIDKLACLRLVPIIIPPMQEAMEGPAIE